MNLATKTMKRLGALLLVFAMVVGMLPMQAFAAEGDPYELKIRLLRTTNNPNTKNETYTYSVEFLDARPKSEASVKYYWDTNFTNTETNPYSDIVNQDNTYSTSTYTTKNKDKAVAVKVVVDGLFRTAVYPVGGGETKLGENTEAAQTYTWTAKTAQPKAYVGIPFSLPDPSTVYEDNFGSGLEGDAKIVTVDTIQSSNCEKTEDGKYLISDIGVVTIKRDIYAGMTTEEDGRPALRWTEYIDFAAQMPDYQVSYKIGGKTVTPDASGNVWVSKAGPITVCIDSTYGDGTTITNTEFLPKISGGSGWKLVGGTYENVIPWDGSGPITVSLGGNPMARTGGVTFLQDATPVTISNQYWYRSDDNVIIKFHYEVGDSELSTIGLGNQNSVSLYVDENTQKPYYVDENGNVTITDKEDGYVSETGVSIKVTNGTGASATATAYRLGDGNLTVNVTLQGTDANPVIDDFAKSSDNVNFNVICGNLSTSGTEGSEGITATIDSVKIGEETQSVSSNNGVFTIFYDDAKAGRILTVTDSLGRNANATLPKLTIDATGPDTKYQISTEKQENGNEIYVDTDATVSVYATDEGGVGTASDIKISYKITNSNGTTTSYSNESLGELASKAFSLTEGDKLHDVVVGNLKDKLGNTSADKDPFGGKVVIVDSKAPEVTATISGGVNSVFKGTDNKLYLGVDDAASAAPILTVIVTDANLGDEITNGGNYGPFTTTKSDDGKTGTLHYDFWAKDKAGNFVTEVPLTVETARTRTTINLTSSDGHFEGYLYMDKSDPVPNPGYTVEESNPVNPRVTVTNSEKQTVNLYKDTITVTVTPNAPDDTHQIAFDKSAGLDITFEKNTDGTYTVTVTPESTGVETKDAYLAMVVTDHAGNKYTHPFLYFAMDNKAPRINRSADKEAANTEMNGAEQYKYYQEPVTFTYTVDDEFINTATVQLGADKTSQTYDTANIEAANGKWEYKIEDKGYSGVLSAVDLAGNKHELNEAFNVVVDKNKPKISEPAIAKDSVNSQLTYTFVVEDDYLDEVTATYKLDGDTENSNVSITESPSDSTKRTVTINIPEGRSLESYTITATDKANHTESRTIVDSEKIIADTHAPVVVANFPAAGTVTNNPTFTITINDKNGALAGTIGNTGAIIVVNYNVTANGTGEDRTLTTEDFAIEDGVATADFTLADGEILNSVTVTAVDAAGNAATENLSYSNLNITADTTKPKVTSPLKFTLTNGVVLKGFYTNSGVTYLSLDPGSAETVQVTATMTVEDANLYNEGLESNSGIWNLNTENGTAVFEKKTDVISKGNKVVLALDFKVTDKAGNVMDFANTDIEEASTSSAAITTIPPYTNSDGTVSMSLTVDFVDPEIKGTAPNIYVSVSESKITDVSVGENKTVPLYGGNNMSSITFTTLITDNDTGLEKATYSISDDKNSGVVSTVTNSELTITEVNSKGRVNNEEITIDFNKAESNNLTLTLYAKDYAGNAVTGSTRFAVDKKAPEVDVTYSTNASNTVSEKLYVQGSRTATVAVTDINFSEETEINGVKYNDWSVDTNDTSKHSKSITFAEESYYSLEVTAKDLANHSTTKTEENFYVDLYVPEVKIEKSSNATIYNGNPENGHVKQYHNDIVKYTITVTDKYLDNVGGNSVQINYTLNGTPVTVKFPENAAAAPAVRADNTVYHEEDENGENDVYTYILALADGDKLTNLTVTATDNSGRTTTAEELENVTVVVDKTPPLVTVEKKLTEGSTSNEHYGHTFHNKPVTYTITVQDANLVSSVDSNGNPGFVNTGSYKLNGVQQNFNLDAGNGGITYTITVNGASDTTRGSDLFSDLLMQFKDSAGNPVQAVTATGGVAFNVNQESGEITCNSNPVVVDVVAPVANVSFGQKEKLLGYYTDAQGVTFIKLVTPTTDGNVKDTVTVTMDFAVADWNLADGENQGLEPNGKWSFTGNQNHLVNTSGTATYSESVSVETNATGQIVLELHVEDLAGNPISKIDFDKINGTVPTPIENESNEHFIKADTDGDVTGIVTLDRRQPTTGDNNPPQIKVEPTVKPVGTTKDGIQLFNSSFGFKLNVNDGAYNTLNAGLQSVEWKVNDGGFVAAAAGTAVQNTHNYDNTINITSVGNGERNDLVLEVKAVDNVGNTITYQEAFALDTLAPRITVEFDNNDVRNDRYFRAERTATIMVEELNFDAAKTEIDSEIKNGAWGTDAQGRHVTTIDYDVDGDYTLHVSSTDLAGNHTPDGSVNYIGVACQAFTIDLTLPIIEVFYDPDIVSGVDEDGVDYYNADQHIGVRIIEHNFSENDVVDEFYINRDQPLGRGLGEFTNNGDNHNAAIVLENGNRYFFRVNYTDLAGNVADGYTSNFFSVDTVPPTIRTISELDNEQLNVVSGDLELQFVVEDAQDNLDTVHVVMTHTNNSFETVMVSGPEFLTITPQKDRSTVTVNIANIQKLKNLDGIYTIELRAYDYAGNIVTLTPPMVISLNRFGSTFTTDDPFTKQFLTPGSDGVVYHNSVNGNLIIQEINPNRVFHDETLKEEGSVLTIVVNGRSIRLEEGEDYTMTVEKRGQEGSYWYCYTYEIDKKVFEEDGELRDGRYSILIYGVDEAGNNNTNESSEYSTLQLDGEGKYTGKIEFTIDTQAPVIITTGIESNEIYNEEFRQMQIEIADATPTSIQVYLNDELVGLSMDAANLPENTLWLTQDKETGIYTLNVNEQTGIFNSQNVRIVATDAAANAAEAEVNDFHISTSFLVRMLNSIWFYLILVAVAAGVVVLVVFSRKKKAAV